MLSDNTLLQLVPGGSDKFVDYEERLQYAKLVQDAQMNDSKQQVKQQHFPFNRVISEKRK